MTYKMNFNICPVPLYILWEPGNHVWWKCYRVKWYLQVIPAMRWFARKNVAVKIPNVCIYSIVKAVNGIIWCVVCMSNDGERKNIFRYSYIKICIRIAGNWVSGIWSTSSLSMSEWRLMSFEINMWSSNRAGIYVVESLIFVNGRPFIYVP